MDDKLYNTLKKKWFLLEKKSHSPLEGMKIKIVSGKETRDKYGVDFIGGGHTMVYKFIPKIEIWIEDIKPVSERNKILAHEMLEICLMHKKHLTYDKAHAIANEYESMLRKGDKPESVFKKYVDKHLDGDEETYELIIKNYGEIL